MSSKKKTPIHLEDLTPDEKVKYEIEFNNIIIYNDFDY